MKITQPKQAALYALNATASGTSYDNSSSGLTADDVQAAIDEIVSGALGAYLTVIGGGKGTVQSLGNLGATETLDLANANLFAGTLNADCTIGTSGWTNGKDCQIMVELTEDGVGGWTPTFSGVSWIGGTPSWDTTAGTVTHVVLFSRDGGTTIYGAVVGGSGIDTSLVTVASSGAAETIDVSVARTYDITLTADCTFSLTGSVAAEAWFVTIIRRQDGTGNRLETWPGSVVWIGGSAPVLQTAANQVDVATLFTVNGGTDWYGVPAGAGGSGAIYAPVMAFDPSDSKWYVVVDGSGNAVMAA